jgi:Holliday junction resolvasome RuvABC endonuclease subunit
VVKILAVDPGSNEVGLYWGPGLSKTLYLIDQSLSKSARAKTPRPERLARLLEKFQYALEMIGPHYVVYEEQFVRGGAATKALFGAVGVIEAVATKYGAGVMPVPQSTMRKWAVSRVCGEVKTLNAKGLYATVSRQFDSSCETEHERDACVLWRFIQEQGEFEHGTKAA